MEKMDLLGKQCQDIVTGYEGICIGLIEWMYGCDEYRLKARTETNGKEAGSSFFRPQLNVTGEGISNIVEIPEYTEQKFFGRHCRDKVTGKTGICIGRIISLFNCDQYVIECKSSSMVSDIEMLWLDEGRVEVLPDREDDIDPADVQSTRAGGIYSPDEYPAVSGSVTMMI